ncbi:hypothetical protein TNCV_3427731 [Trichonephila clavipes]|nr:hypothetical protein TNCV_3427731 [Trichonephila clavipes]
MYSSSPIGLSMCSWNANGLLRRNAELRIFIEKHSPDILLIQETHLRPSHNFNIANYTCHRNDRITDGSRTAEHKISEFTEAVIETHSHASQPIETDRRNFTPQHINRLLKLKNHLRKQYHQTLNPLFKTQYIRAQSDFKKELKKHNDSIWQKRLETLNTTDNSLWRTQKFFKNKRPKIPPLNCATVTAVTDQQKANLLATNIKNNFIENDRENDSYSQSDEIINSTVNNFLSTPPTTLIQPALPDEIIHYIKHVNAKKAPGQPIGVTVHFTQQPIREQLLSSKPRQKLLKTYHPDKAQKPRLPDPIVQPIVVMPLSRT